MEDARLLLDGYTTFVTMDGQVHNEVDACEWDLIIAHPPCTYLTGVAVKFHSTKVCTIEEINERTKLRIEGINFFMRCATARCKRIAIENPIGIMGTVYRKPDQIIEPYMFAESVDDKANYVTKRTCLWLKGLPPLETNDLEKPNNAEMFGKYSTGRNKTWVEMSRSAEVRSRTFPGVARAMAEQWGKI